MKFSDDFPSLWQMTYDKTGDCSSTIELIFAVHSMTEEAVDWVSSIGVGVKSVIPIRHQSTISTGTGSQSFPPPFRVQKSEGLA